MHVVKPQKAKELEVMIVPVDVATKVAKLKTSLDPFSLDEGCDAGNDVGGTFRTCSAGIACPNYKVVSSSYGLDEYCSQEEYCKRLAQVNTLEHLIPMLDFYWNTRGKTGCQSFLRDCGLITRYEFLKTERFDDAAVIYGAEIPALLLVDGWNTHRLLKLIGFAVLLGILVTALGSAVGHNINEGLTLGMNAFGVVAVLIAAPTFFSEIL